MIHADGKCYGTDGDGSDGYECRDGALWGPHPTDHDTTRRYVMRCYCPCHDHHKDAPEPAHDYLSTGCLHGRHDYCQATDGQAGPKTPAECKWCPAKCRCHCHQETT